jgi:hypothetical protein
VQRKWIADSPEEVARIVEMDLELLKVGNVKPTLGDIRCITFGHLVRLAIWSLRLEWKKTEPTITRIARVKDWLQHFGNWTEVEKRMKRDRTTARKEMPLFAVHESVGKYGADYADISF